MPKPSAFILNPIVIRNLIFDYEEQSGKVIFKEMGHMLESHPSMLLKKELNTRSASKLEYWGTNGLLIDDKIGQLSYVNALQGIEKAKVKNETFYMMPCNLDWSSANSRLFAVSLRHGKCIKFIASSYGDIYVVFVTNPNDENTWYTIQISSYGVALYKVTNPLR
jgi:hypothetical protein